MNRICGTLLILFGAAITASASRAPEIDPSMGGSALALLSGAVLVLRGKKRK